jgi:transcriptional regulator with XRE-family HTH domain
MEKGNKPNKGEKQPMGTALRKEEIENIKKPKNPFIIKDEFKEDYYESGFPKEIKRSKHDLPISDRLFNARKFRKLSLQDVTDILEKRFEIKTRKTTIQGYEVDEDNLNHRYPSLHILYRICQIYNVNVDYIFGFSDEMERPSQDLFENLDNGIGVYIEGVKMTSKEIGLLKDNAKGIMALRPNPSK